MLPKALNKKLIDLNTAKLEDIDIQWTDYGFISAMSIQSESVDEVIRRCKKSNTKIIAGGPLFTSSSEYH